MMKSDTTQDPETAAEWYEHLNDAINSAIFTGEDFRPEGMRIIQAIQASALDAGYRKAREEAKP